VGGKLAPFLSSSARCEIRGLRFYAGSPFLHAVAAWSTFIAAERYISWQTWDDKLYPPLTWSYPFCRDSTHSRTTRLSPSSDKLRKAFLCRSVTYHVGIEYRPSEFFCRIEGEGRRWWCWCLGLLQAGLRHQAIDAPEPPARLGLGGQRLSDASVWGKDNVE